MAKKTFFRGAMILTLAGVLGKFLSAAYRVPFNRMVGAEGAGIYSMSYSIYSIIFALSTAGIPLAVSKLVAMSEERAEKGESLRIVRVALILLACVGLAAAVLFFLAAPWIATVYFNEPRAAWSLRALAPAMLFSCLMAVFRGFFQGRQNMVPTAISQILEQFFRVGTILLSLFLLLHKPVEYVVTGASFGSMVGGVCGFLFLALVFVRFLRKHRTDQGPFPSRDPARDQAVLKQLLYYAVPISIGALLLPMTSFIDSSLVARRLEFAGLGHSEAIAQLGYLSNYAMPIINLPFIVTTAISASLVPAVADALARHDQDALFHNVRQGMRLTMVLVLPASMGLAVLSTGIATLLYNDAEAGSVLAALAFTVFVVGLYQCSASILQGLGKVLIPMYHLLLGLVLKFALTWVLTGYPTLGASGAALATVLAFGCAGVFNVIRLSGVIGWGWCDPYLIFLKPLLASLVMGLLCYGSYGFLTTWVSASWATLLAIMLGGLAYFVVLFAIKGIDLDTLAAIPKIGPKLKKILAGK